jgi:ABC-type nitrate/sulfonate/bicarbonate transport system permease component
VSTVAAPTAAPRTKRKGGPWQAIVERESTILPLATFGALLALWEIGARTGALDTFFFSSPSRIFAAGYREMQIPRFWNDVSISTQEFTIGYVLAVVVAVPFGLVTGWFRTLHDLFDPWLSAFNATPRLALLPLVVLWVGLGMESKILIVFLGVFFPVAVNTFYGVHTVDANYIEVSRSFGASTWKRIWTVVLPSVTPFALVGMRIGIGRAVGGVIVAEFFTSNAGLGNYIFRAGQQLQTDNLLFGALFITILALLVFRAASSVEQRFKVWRPKIGSA